MILAHKLAVINRNGWKYVRNHLTHPDLTNSMYDVCGIIYQVKSCNQDYIVKTLKIDKSALTKVINKCVEDGLVNRTINSSNRREHILSLTDKGNDTIKELIDLVDAWQKEILSVLEEEKCNLFMEMIDKVFEHANEVVE